MRRATYEIESFTGMVNHGGSPSCGRSTGLKPWLPNGPSRQHLRFKRDASQEQEACERERERETAVQRGALMHSQLDAAEAAMHRLEANLDGVVADFEAHVISAASSSVLVLKRLQDMGLDPDCT